MTGNDRWAQFPQYAHPGPIATSVSLVDDIPEYFLGKGDIPWQDSLNPRGRWRLTVRCEWTGTAEEWEQYQSEHEEAA